MTRNRSFVKFAALGATVLLGLLIISWQLQHRVRPIVPETRKDQQMAVPDATAPQPMLAAGQPVDWWFVFKFNAKAFPGCGAAASRSCAFGGTVKNYAFGQQYVYASSQHPALQQGSGGCVGDTAADPLGATFNQIYHGNSFYLIWNDQFYDDPPIKGCSKECGAPWGHSKGLLAWNDAGNGLVLQVSTPSWPAAGSERSPRHDGNTLGCVNDDNVKVSQHFFALRLNKDDLVKVLEALGNASVVTDPSNPQLVHNGGPADVQTLVAGLGQKSTSRQLIEQNLTSGVKLISKPSALQVPPWQMVSARLGGVALRTATWWTKPPIPTTPAGTAIGCWSDGLGQAGPVEIALHGQWGGTSFGLTGGPGSDNNHAKLGVAGAEPYAVLGDLNQQGTLDGPNCGSSQNGRGGLFYVLKDAGLAQSLRELLNGDTAPARPSKGTGKNAGSRPNPQASGRAAHSAHHHN
jgi:hypothetical protein